MRVIVSLALILFSVVSDAQELTVRSVRRIKPDTGGSYLVAGVLPGSKNLLVTGDGYKGLSILNVRNGKIRKITEAAGAGNNPVVTEGGMSILFRSDSFPENRKHTSLYLYSLETGLTKKLLDGARGVSMTAIPGNRVLIISDKGTAIETTGGAVSKSSIDDLFVTTEDLVPVLYIGNVKKTIKPNGDGYYIWVSLSPDGKKIVYNFQGINTFICDLDGNILHNAGRINAPVWLSNDIIIGMDDKDDGYRVLSSELVYYSLRDKERRNLTRTANRSEMYPLPFSGERNVAFCTDKGELYLLKFRIRR